MIRLGVYTDLYYMAILIPKLLFLAYVYLRPQVGLTDDQI